MCWHFKPQGRAGLVRSAADDDGMRASGKAIELCLLLVAIWSKNTSYSGLAFFAAGRSCPENGGADGFPVLFTKFCIGISTIVGNTPSSC